METRDKGEQNKMTSERTPMTSGEYTVEYEGGLCPLCRSDEISASSNVHVYQDVIYRKVECSECGASWQEELRAVGYSGLRRKVITYEPAERGE